MEIGIFNTGLLFKARDSETQKVEARTELLKQTLDRQKLQEEYYGIRDKLKSDLHDANGRSLSSIQIYSFAARQKLEMGDQEQTQSLLGSIASTSESLLNTMGDMVWAINPENDTNEKRIERISVFSLQILAARDCSFNTEIDPAFLSYSMNQAQRRNTLLIIKEAVINAAKYSKAKEMKLEIHRHCQKL